MRRRRGAAGAALVLVLLALAGSVAASAQERERSSRLDLAAQTPWVGPGQAFEVRVKMESPLPREQVELSVSVYRRVASRSEFALTLDDRLRGAALLTSPAALLSELTLDPAGAYYVRIPVQDPAQPPEPGVLQLRLRDDGVYPVRIEARRRDGELLDRLTTHLVYTTPPEADAPKLQAALVLPVHAAPALRADGTRDLPEDARRRLSDLAAALEARPQVPLTLAPTPETVQALAQRDPDALAALRRALPGRRVLGAPYVPVDAEVLVRADLQQELAAQVERGRRVLEDTLGVEVVTDVAVVDEPLDERGIQGLRARGVERLVVPDPLLSAVDLPVTLTQPFELATRDVRRPPAVAADPGLAAHFTDGGGAVLRAHHFLADLAVLAFDRPGRARGVVAMPPPSWRPTGAFLRIVLDALAQAPAIAPATLDTLFAEVPPATTGRGVTLQRSFRPEPRRAERGNVPVEAIRGARRQLQSFSSMLDSANPRDDAFEEHLLVAQSRDVRATRRAGYVDGLLRRIDRELALVRVPADRTVTLTARRGEIPVTVLSEADYPVTLDVRVASDRLGFPDGATRRVELTRRNSTQQFSVEARGSGTFPLRVRLVSPDGGLVVGETRFTVRSTAFSGVGLVLSFGALGVLFAWWGRSFARGRRNRRLVAS